MGHIWLVSAVLAVCCFVISAEAQIITQPSGLKQNQPYRLVFITTTTQQGNPGGGSQDDVPDMETWNQVVRDAVAATPDLTELGATWYAIVSVNSNGTSVVESVDARDNTLTNTNNPAHPSVPIYNLNGQKIAEDNNDLWDGNLLEKILYRNDGSTFTDSLYGQSNSDGTFAALSKMASGNTTGSGWIAGSADIGTVARPVYGISSVLAFNTATVILVR